MHQYHDLSHEILKKGDYIFNERTGVGTIDRFGTLSRYDLREGFPLMTTKRMYFNGIAHELVWFLRGDTNIKYLVDNKTHIWDGNAFQHYLKKQGLEEKFKMYSLEWEAEKKDFISKIKEDDNFAKKHGDLGDVYGAQWRHWKHYDEKEGKVVEFDQLKNVINNLKKKHSARRHVVSAWNPPEISNMALPPCHMIYQFRIHDGKLDCLMVQRSADTFLGVPFNIASYALLTNIVAQELELESGEFVHPINSSHFYCGVGKRAEFYKENLDEIKVMMSEMDATTRGHAIYNDISKWIENNAPPEEEGKEKMDHVPLVLMQMSRKPMGLPRVTVARTSFGELRREDIQLVDYKSHPPVPAKMAV